MSIEQLRTRINKIDDELLALLNERAKVVIEIGKLRKKMAPRFMPLTANGKFLTAF